MVWFNWDGHIKVIEKDILMAFDELQIQYETCYWEEYESKSKEYDPVVTLFFHPNQNIYKIIPFINEAKGHKLLWDMESPYESDIVFDMLPHIHYIFCSDKATVEQLKKENYGNEIFYVPHACNPKIHKPIDSDDIPHEYKSDYVLVGNAYKSRIDFLKEHKDMFKGKILTVVGVGYWGLPGFKNQNFIKHHVSQEECILFYNGAKCVLNPHRTNSDLDMANKRGIVPEHLNNRFYEVSAIGKPQFVHNRDQMKDEIEAIQKLKPDQYSYVARLKEFYVPLLK